MRYFFPDSQDLVDPSFDFKTEKRAIDRIRQRDDEYAHEVFTEPAFDGLLVSKGIVDGFGESGGRYTIAQRHRLLRVGAREFFRLDRPFLRSLPVMGDCGAFTYVREKTPPYSVDEVINFYIECKFDLGISVDHVILAYKFEWDSHLTGIEIVPEEVRERQAITLQLASEFLSRHHSSKLGFVPLGVAQGWSPESYAHAVNELQKMGYGYIALGGVVPLKTHDILDCLKAIKTVRLPETKIHLLGVARTESIPTFKSYGVASFDSTSPLRRAFKDAKDNYYTMDREYTAVRVPQVEGNTSLRKRIQAGIISQEKARELERDCIELLAKYDVDQCSIEDVLIRLRDYEQLYDPSHNHSDAYREVLTIRPWRYCGCDICQKLGYHVILFRGAERNRRRGFHNVWVFYRRLHRELGKPLDSLLKNADLTVHQGGVNA